MEERQEGERAEIDAGHIGLVDRLPVVDTFTVPDLLVQLVGGRGIRGRFGTRDTGITDQQIEVLLLRRDLSNELFEVRFGSHITGPDTMGYLVSSLGLLQLCLADLRYDFPCFIRVMGLRRVLEHLHSPAGDVDFGACSRHS